MSHSLADVSLLIGHKLRMNIGRELVHWRRVGTNEVVALIAVSPSIGQLHARVYATPTCSFSLTSISSL